MSIIWQNISIIFVFAALSVCAVALILERCQNVLWVGGFARHFLLFARQVGKHSCEALLFVLVAVWLDRSIENSFFSVISLELVTAFFLGKAAVFIGLSAFRVYLAREMYLTLERNVACQQQRMTAEKFLRMAENVERKARYKLPPGYLEFYKEGARILALSLGLVNIERQGNT